MFQGTFRSGIYSGEKIEFHYRNFEENYLVYGLNFINVKKVVYSIRVLALIVYRSVKFFYTYKICLVSG